MDAIVPANRLETIAAPGTAWGHDGFIFIDQDGFQIHIADPSQVGCVDISVSAELFETYEVDSGFIESIDMEKIANFLYLVNSNVNVKFTMDEESRRFTLQAQDLIFNLAPRKKSYLLDLDDYFDETRPSTIGLMKNQLASPAFGGDLASQHLDISIDPTETKVVFTADGDHVTMRCEYTQDELQHIIPADVNSTFETDYLSDMLHAIPSETTVSLALGTESSMKLEYTIFGSLATVKFRLKQRISPLTM